MNIGKKVILDTFGSDSESEANSQKTVVMVLTGMETGQKELVCVPSFLWVLQGQYPKSVSRWSLASLSWKEFQRSSKENTPITLSISAQPSTSSSLLLSGNYTQRGEGNLKIHVEDICGTAWRGRKDLGKKAFDPVDGRREQSDRVLP